MMTNFFAGVVLPIIGLVSLGVCLLTRLLVQRWKGLPGDQPDPDGYSLFAASAFAILMGGGLQLLMWLMLWLSTLGIGSFVGASGAFRLLFGIACIQIFLAVCNLINIPMMFCYNNQE